MNSADVKGSASSGVEVGLQAHLISGESPSDLETDFPQISAVTAQVDRVNIIPTIDSNMGSQPWCSLRRRCMGAWSRWP